MDRIKLAAFIAALSLLTCKKEAVTEPAEPLPGKPSAPANVPAEPEAPKGPIAGCNSDFSAPLTADTTLTEKCSPYSVKSELNIDAITLTIEPGVVLEFEAGGTLFVGYYKPARVLAKGTREKPVKFTGRAWKGLRIQKEGAGSSFENVIVENAGTEDDAAFVVETHDLTLNALTFKGARKTALELKIDKPLKALAGIDFTQASEDPTELIHAHLATAGVFGPDNKFPPGAIIWLHQSLDAEVTLVNPGAVYRIPEMVNVDPPEGKTASLTVKEGVTLELGENAALQFGYYRGPAGLKIQGTREKPVTVTRFGEDKAETPSGGLQFFAGARAPDLDFLVLEYAGGADKSALLHAQSHGLGKLTNSTFRHLKGEAVRVDGAKERFTAFDNNTFEDVDNAALRIPLELAHGLGANNKFTDKARVTLFGETKKDTTLASIGAAYVVEGELAVNGEETKAATLTIAPGNTLLFNDQGKLAVAYYSAAKLVAKGTPEKPITFGKLLGSWGGVGIYGKGSIELENAALSGTGDEIWPLDLADDVTGTVKTLAMTDTKRGIHGCATKVKPEGATADKGVKAVEKCR